MNICEQKQAVLTSFFNMQIYPVFQFDVGYSSSKTD